MAKAFAETSRKGLRKFFECRAEELAPGGVLAVLCTARRDRAHPEVQLPDGTMNLIPVLEKAWKELINEVSRHSCHSFRIRKKQGAIFFVAK